MPCLRVSLNDMESQSNWDAPLSVPHTLKVTLLVWRLLSSIALMHVASATSNRKPEVTSYGRQQCRALRAIRDQLLGFGSVCVKFSAKIY